MGTPFHFRTRLFDRSGSARSYRRTPGLDPFIYQRFPPADRTPKPKALGNRSFHYAPIDRSHRQPQALREFRFIQQPFARNWQLILPHLSPSLSVREVSHHRRSWRDASTIVGDARPGSRCCQNFFAQRNRRCFRVLRALSLTPEATRRARKFRPIFRRRPDRHPLGKDPTPSARAGLRSRAGQSTGHGQQVRTPRRIKPLEDRQQLGSVRGDGHRWGDRRGDETAGARFPS